MYNFRIDKEITSDGWWGDYFTPSMLLEHLKLASGKDLLIDINCVGGCVVSGMAMYAELKRYAKEHGATITTRTSGFVASIATAVFLAGHKRIVNEYLQPFVHEPFLFWSDSQTADEFKKDAKDLEQVRDVLAKFYENNTKLTYDEALEYMKNDTWITAGKCLEIGFATEIEKFNSIDAKIYASISNKYNRNKNSKNMSKKNKSTWLRAFGLISKNVSAKLELSDESGTSIVFPNLEEGDAPLVGETVHVGEDESYTGTVETSRFIIEIEDGKVTALIDKDEVGSEELIKELTDIIEKKDDEIDSLKNKLKAYLQVESNGEKKGDGARNSKQNQSKGGVSEIQASVAKMKERYNKK